MARYSNTRLILRLILDFLILCCVFCVALIALPRMLSTTQRGFFCEDESLQYPYTPSLLTKVHLTLVVIALPAAILLAVEMLRAAFVPLEQSSASISGGAAVANTRQFMFLGFRIPTFVSECYKLVGVYLFGLALQLIATGMTQRFVGRLRPYFFDVCQPQLLREGPDKESGAVGFAACADGMDSDYSRYIVNFNCTDLATAADLLVTMRHSFPSTFTTATAYAMCFLVLYLQARMTAAWLTLLRATLQFCGLGLVALVALERVNSYQNHWTDVAAGLLLGLVLAVFSVVFVAQLFEPVKVKPRRWKDDNGIYSYGYYGARRI